MLAEVTDIAVLALRSHHGVAAATGLLPEAQALDSREQSGWKPQAYLICGMTSFVGE